VSEALVSAFRRTPGHVSIPRLDGIDVLDDAQLAL